jgi:fumarate hydratase class II
MVIYFLLFYDFNLFYANIDINKVKFVLNKGIPMKTRIEKDSIGEIHVPEKAYWGAQTQRSLMYFAIGEDTMPTELLLALAHQKKAAATANLKAGLLDKNIKQAMFSALNEIIDGQFWDHFPLSVWQTGSGTQTNMNMNEVVANRANEILGEALSSQLFVHPNDHVNRSQSSNDTFPTVMHMAAHGAVLDRLMPALLEFGDQLTAKTEAFADIIKVGRTHMQDATPLTLGQVFSGYVAHINDHKSRLQAVHERLRALPQGGTAVGTGLNTPVNFREDFIEALNDQLLTNFYTTPNCFAEMAAHDTLVELSSVCNGLAVTLMKIANDIRLLSSGPRCGLGELILPANEPGSSIMPGKVNPTQCEALSMVAAQVMGYHTACTIAGSQGHLELNVYKPLLISNVLNTVRLLSDSMVSFSRHALAGLQANHKRIQHNLDNSLMLVTALTPCLGYDKAGEIAKTAHAKNISLRQAAIDLGYITGEQFDTIVDYTKMI